jgi:hypothetical protein
MLRRMHRMLILCIGFPGCASTSSVTDTTVKARLNIELGSRDQQFSYGTGGVGGVVPGGPLPGTR